MVSKYPDETLCMRGMNLNLCFLRMLEDTISLFSGLFQYVGFRDKLNSDWYMYRQNAQAFLSGNVRNNAPSDMCAQQN